MLLAAYFIKLRTRGLTNQNVCHVIIDSLPEFYYEAFSIEIYISRFCFPAQHTCRRIFFNVFSVANVLEHLCTLACATSRTQTISATNEWTMPASAISRRQDVAYKFVLSVY